MSPSDFLSSRTGRSWESDRTGAACEFYIGEGGGNALEIVVTNVDDRPRKDFLQNTYTDRRGGRVSPILVVALYDDTADLCGPSGEDPVVYREVDPNQASRVCDVALNEPNRHEAERFLVETLPQLDEDLTGVRNQGLLSTHELRVGVPERDDWTDATTKAQEAVADDPREMLQDLNYGIERLTDQSYVLTHAEDGRESAVAVFLQEDESFDHAQDRFVGESPVAYALNEADKKNVDYVIGSDGDTLRLYTTNPEAGFGSRGQTDTYVEVNTSLLADDKAGYLWLLFSADALQNDGSLHDIMERSKDYAAALGARLRERIYDDVVPDLAEAIARARDLADPDKEQLDQTYEMTLVLLYRLLFITYTEDEEFLPRRRNAQYDSRSLKQKAHDLHETVQADREFDENLTTHWDDVMTLTRAIHRGHAEWSLPEYDGRLLSEDPDWSEAGAKLANIRLSDAEFGPALANLLIDETEDGFQGPVDFRNIGVREFGVIYEGLLESELSVADQPLGTDDEGRYEPVNPDEREVVVEEDEIYLHGQSGERKATGTYYTKTRFVEHLLDHSLEPALDDHIERIDRLRQEEGDATAADAFFDLRVADIAMGSGHFLVSAIDRIEARLRSYLTDNTLAGVESELDNLEDAALGAFEHDEYTPTVERGQLLRRQVARRCIYGVDQNSLATELARLSLWVHTFVPGLPLTSLDYNLTVGDSLVGMGPLDESSDILGKGRGNNHSLASFAGDDVIDEIRNDIEKLGQFADTSAERVVEARKTREKIDERLEPVRARFDILAASRVDDDISAKTASKTDIDPRELSSYNRSQEILESFDVLHFPAAFPEVFMDNGGFDVIVGNPPWDKLLFEPQQFWVTRDPGLNALPKTRREERREELRNEHPQQAKEEQREKAERENQQQYMKSAFEDQGRGHYDYSKLFVERADKLLNDRGEFGYVLPRQSLVLGGWKRLRRRLIDGSELTVLQARNRGGWIFENIHHSYMIVLLTSSPSAEKNGAHIWPAIEEEQAIDNVSLDNSIYLTREDIANLTTEDRLVIPWFNRDEARDVFPKMEEQPRLSSGDGWISGTHDSRWDFRGSGRHSHISNSNYEPGYWRVFMTRSVDQFEINEEKEFRRFVDPDDLIAEGEAVSKANGTVSLGDDHPTVVFRHVSRNDDTRTIIATILPETGFVHCAGYVHAINHEEKTTPTNRLALLAYMNSFACDWWCRRILDRHVTSPAINNLPLPNWENEQIEEAAELAAELVGRGGTETMTGGHSIPSESTYEDMSQEQVRARIEGLVANGFNLGQHQYDAILDDFSDTACSSTLTSLITEHLPDGSMESAAMEDVND